MTTLLAERDSFFATARFDQYAYEQRWLSFPLGPLSIHYPMTSGMRVALPRHDLHHVLSGYGIDAIGEAEIAAWELGSGCGRLLTAWFGNLAFMSLGVLVRPRRVMAAFLRGRATTNLYASPSTLAELLPRSVDEVRSELGLATPLPRPRLRDRLLAVATAAASLVTGVVFLLALIPLSLFHAANMKRPSARATCWRVVGTDQ